MLIHGLFELFATRFNSLAFVGRQMGFFLQRGNISGSFLRGFSKGTLLGVLGLLSRLQSGLIT